MAAIGVFVVIRFGNSLLTTVGFVATLAYFVVVGLMIAISLCPRCRCLIDLREGGFKCPRCGVWIPPGKGAPPSGK